MFFFHVTCQQLRGAMPFAKSQIARDIVLLTHDYRERISKDGVSWRILNRADSVGVYPLWNSVV